jgi:hypothetical protein
MTSRILVRRMFASLVILGLGSLNALGGDAGSKSDADVAEALQVSRSVADLASVCSGRMGLSYAISGITGRWQISLSPDGDQWTVRRRDDAPALPVGDMLRSLADVDTSGSASLEEVGRLHRLLHFGYIQEHFRGTVGYDLEGLMVATGLDPASLEAMRTDYSDLTVRAAERGLIWPGGR